MIGLLPDLGYMVWPPLADLWNIFVAWFNQL
ncbi:hypothetical protein E143388_08418 [Rhodococcus opacus]|nr:hypothetical protein E143388_08418 [Rhodococcus opacus]